MEEVANTDAAPHEFHVVGIGASAGGITALQTLFRSMPDAPNLAFVVVQHTLPDHPGQLAGLLAKWTPMPVREAADGIKVERSSVFVAPPGHVLTLERGVFATRPHDGAAPRAGIDTIDAFFDSLARDVGPRAIAVVLSGTGADGAAGAVRIKQAGGIVLVQDPTTALHDGMPSAAIANGAADHILPLAPLAQELVGCASPSYERSSAASSWGDDVTTVLDAIIDLIRFKAGFDLTGYKTTPLLWRIQRRMEFRRVLVFRDYEALLHDDPAELETLVRGIPIHVTEFFRDAAAWESLQRTVVPQLFADAHDGAIRAWTAACATGEEAYSVAMLLAEHAATLEAAVDFQVFATDASAEIVGRARRGIFKSPALNTLSAARRRRFFYAADGAFRVKRSLREKMVFAPQDLLADPPFLHLDFVTCRNLLIYLDREAANRVLYLLHASLRMGGYLFLGSGESLPSRERGFEEVAPHTRIYRKTGPSSDGDVQFLKRPVRVRRGRSNSSAVDAHTHEAALETLDVPGVLVDDQFQILRVYGDTGPFLCFRPGEPSLNITQLLPPGNQLEPAARQALSEGRAVTVRFLPDPATGALTLSIRVTPLHVREDAGTRLLISFLSTPNRPTPVHETAGTAMLMPSPGMDTTDWSEALRVTHDELDASREELQALNEELRASNDQLNIANEELNQANNQLRENIAELETQSNVLASGAVMALFLDDELRMRWFTPGINNLFPVKVGDVGRSISDLAPKFDRPAFLDDVRAVMNIREPREAEVRTFDGRWYLQRIRPFRTDGGERAAGGVAITFTDVTDRKSAEATVRESEAALAAELDDMTRLHEFSTAIVGARTVQNLLEVAVDTIIGLHAADFGTVQLYEAEAGVLRVAAQRGFDAGFLESFAEVDASESSACGQAMARRARVSIEDIEMDELSESFRGAATCAGYRAVQSTPLTTAAGAPLGMISTYFRGPRTLSDAEQRTTDILAHELSIAIERVHAEQTLRSKEQILRGNQAWLAAQKEAFQAAMNGAALATSLGVLVRTVIEQSKGECRSAFYIANAAGGGLRHVVGMSDAYAQNVDGFAISPELLACGLAVATGTPVITPDVLEEDRWKPWTSLAREYEYRGCWSFPVETASGQLVGSFAMYFKEPRTPTALEYEFAASVTQTAAIIISRHQQVEQRAKIEAALRES